MRWSLLLALVACKASDSKPSPATKPPPAPPSQAAQAPGPKPPDEMDERMRHCPLALDGATSTLSDIAGGVRFVVTPSARDLEEARRRAHHLVEFAAKKTRAGHGDFDGRGGGRMKNCPVITDDVTITVVDLDGAVQLDVVSQTDAIQPLRDESRARAARFPFDGATIRVADPAANRSAE